MGGGDMGDFTDGGWGQGLQWWEEVDGGIQYLEYKVKYNNTYI